jgi:transposase InsO family protein
MAQKVVTMETKLRAVLAAGLEGVQVSGVCRQLGISRQTFYKYQRRWRAEGPAGLVERSRRPARSPNQTPVELEDEIVRLRDTLPLENGAQTIAYYLARNGWPVPSVATIHRILVRRGLVVAQPEKRPRAAWRRFEWPRPNDAWQIDATRWGVVDRRELWVMDVLDDHSRLMVAARVCVGASGAAAWDAFSHGANDWGLPARVMSDNGTCFTGRFLSGSEAAFERALRQLGITHIRSRPAHPQTCGKLERAHRTMKQWLAQQPAAHSETELQTQLDEWRGFYNYERPHRSLDGATPAERWHHSPPARPGTPIPQPPEAGLRPVSPLGDVNWNSYRIGVGAQHAGEQVLVIARGDELTLWGATGILRELQLDRSRRYQPTGKPPGRKPRRPVSPMS